MRLRKLTLRHFRNVGFAALEFSGRQHFLVGGNGQGKTNLLEAAGFLTALRSFRTTDNKLLVGHRQHCAALAFVIDHLAALKGVIPGLVSFSAGPNTSPEGRTLGFTHGFVMDFEDAAARDAYLPHPKHQEAAAHLRAIREPENGVLVFDYDL